MAVSQALPGSLLRASVASRIEPAKSGATGYPTSYMMQRSDLLRRP